MLPKQLSRLPFLAALIIGVAFQPLNIFDFHQREIGTAHVAPWRQTLSVLAVPRAVTHLWHSLLAFLRAPGRARLALAAAVLVLAVFFNDADTAGGVGMALTVGELRIERKRLADQAEEILQKSRSENREPTKEEEAQFDAIHVDIEKLRKQIEREERQATVTASLADGQGRRSEPTQPGATDRRERGTSRLIPGGLDRLEALRAWFLAGSDQTPTPEHRDVAQRVGVDLAKRQLHLWLPINPLRSRQRDDVREWEEQRAQSVGTGSAGGFTVPDEPMRELEGALLQFGGMRQAATVIRTDSGADLPWPTSNDTTNKGARLGENTAVSEQDMVFNQLVLQAFKYTSKLLRVSVELLQDNAVNVANVVGRALGERLGRIHNEEFTTGTGSAMPNGIVTASTLGRTGAAGQTTTIIFDDLVELEHSVDPAYRQQGAKWMMHDSMLKVIKKLKDTQNRPLWLAGLAVREPDTILGYPYIINQDVAVPAASAKSLLFGALDKYIIRDVREITLIRLDERYAEFHQVAYLAFSRNDGDLLNAGTNPVKHYAHPAA